MHMFGIGMDKDEAKAIQWVTLAANGGNKDGQYLMGTMLLEGKMMQEDKGIAAEWLEKAAKQGHRDAQYNLGVMLQDGDGVEQDEQQAEYWLRLSEAGLPAQEEEEDEPVIELSRV